MDKKVQQSIREAIEAVGAMDTSVRNIDTAMRQMTALVKNHHKAVRTLRGSDSEPQRNPIDEVRKLEVTFEKDYLQLQVAMQRENRAYTTLSNVLKARHDTVKNSLENIR